MPVFHHISCDGVQYGIDVLVGIYSDKVYTLLWLVISILFTSSLTMIACSASALNIVGYLFVLGCRFQRFVWISVLISSCSSSALVAPNPLRDSTLGGGSFSIVSLVVLGLSDVGSAVVFCGIV